MSERPKSNLTPIGKLISDSMDQGFLGLAREMVRVFEVWEKALGQYNASKTRPESVKDGKLTVIVESPVWIDHFNYLKAGFLENINRELGTGMIREIIFRAGTVHPVKKNVRGKSAVTPDEARRASLDSPEIQAALEAISDPELKAQLAEFLSFQSVRPKE